MSSIRRARFGLPAALLLVLAACGGAGAGQTDAGDTGTTTTSTTTSTTTTTTTADPPGVDDPGIHTASLDLGTVLVDGEGFTLYLFQTDSGGESACVGACEATWPPLLSDELGTPGDGVNAAMLGEITRPDGSLQVTYNGKPVYRYAGDVAPGDTNGQGVDGAWFTMGADGSGIGVLPIDDPYGYDY